MYKFKFSHLVKNFSRKVGNIKSLKEIGVNTENSHQKINDKLKDINPLKATKSFNNSKDEAQKFIHSRDVRIKLKATDGMFYEEIKFPDHYPVMWRNVMKILEENVNLDPGSPIKVIGDFTLGAGNHTRLILDNFENTRVVGIDLDPKMVEYTGDKLDHYIQDDRLVIVEESYVCVEDLSIAELFENSKETLFSEKKKFDFMLLDLGFNSMQLNHSDKGLSFKNMDSNLDMRYDTNNDTKAKASDILNNASELELMEIFSRYADEKNYEAIAKSVIKYREDKKFEKVGDFIKVIDKTYEGKDRYADKYQSEEVNEDNSDIEKENEDENEEEREGKTNNKSLVNYHGHVSKSRYNIYTRLFQALRIVVNYELTNIQRFLNKAFFNMEFGGILAVISFHSAEDKLVKNVFKEMEKMKLGKMVFKKGEKACRQEKEENSRSHSAIIRAIQFNPYK
jgi:16S rRNA (cytosine1402-N4)-methyltransferase